MTDPVPAIRDILGMPAVYDTGRGLAYDDGDPKGETYLDDLVDAADELRDEVTC